MGKDAEKVAEYMQPGPSAYPAQVTITRQFINERPAFMEIRVRSPSKDGLSKGAEGAILIPLKDWEDFQIKVIS